EKRDLDDEQGRHDDRDQRKADRDRDRNVSARPTLGFGSRRALRGLAHQTSRSSASLCLRTSSMVSTCFLVSPSSRFSAPVRSSSPISPSFSALSSVCLAVRRRLRIATRPSSAFVRASLMYSL